MFKYIGMLLVSAFIISAVAPGFIHDAQAREGDRKGYNFRNETPPAVTLKMRT